MPLLIPWEIKFLFKVHRHSLQQDKPTTGGSSGPAIAVSLWAEITDLSEGDWLKGVSVCSLFFFFLSITTNYLFETDFFSHSYFFTTFPWIHFLPVVLTQVKWHWPSSWLQVWSMFRWRWRSNSEVWVSGSCSRSRIRSELVTLCVCGVKLSAKTLCVLGEAGSEVMDDNHTHLFSEQWCCGNTILPWGWGVGSAPPPSGLRFLSFAACEKQRQRRV